MKFRIERENGFVCLRLTGKIGGKAIEKTERLLESIETETTIKRKTNIFISDCCEQFPTKKREILQAFAAECPDAVEYYKAEFPHGGRRKGSGRPKGTKRTNRTQRINISVTPDEKEFILLQLEKYRQEHGKNND